METYVTTAVEDDNGTALVVDGRRVLATLGPDEDAVAVKIQELLQAVTASVGGSITSPSKLRIELEGAISVKVEGGVKYLFFNLGGEARRSSTMKVVLETDIRPAQ